MGSYDKSPSQHESDDEEEWDQIRVLSTHVAAVPGGSSAGRNFDSDFTLRPDQSL